MLANSKYLNCHNRLMGSRGLWALWESMDLSAQINCWEYEVETLLEK